MYKNEGRQIRNLNQYSTFSLRVISERLYHFSLKAEAEYNQSAIYLLSVQSGKGNVEIQVISAQTYLHSLFLTRVAC